MKKRIISIFLLMSAAMIFAGGIYLIFFYNYDAYKRQDMEESLADVYIDYLVEFAEELDLEAFSHGAAEETCKTQEDTPESAVPQEPEETTAVPATAGDDGIIHMGWDYEDDTYYERNGITYTPDYANGYLLCVLEYPAVKIRRGVYSGTWDDIYADLDMWMVTAAHPDMELGRTHLSIYGHNHTSQNLSFNNLNRAKVGDRFYLYSESGVYTYEVVNIFSDWRADTTRKYVEDFSIGSDTCYIITCGRDYFLIGGESTRYKDFIVEGHLIEHTTLAEYANGLLIDNSESLKD